MISQIAAEHDSSGARQSSSPSVVGDSGSLVNANGKNQIPEF
jgi:hypothetical protein